MKHVGRTHGKTVGGAWAPARTLTAGTGFSTSGSTLPHSPPGVPDKGVVHAGLSEPVTVRGRGETEAGGGCEHAAPCPRHPCPEGRDAGGRRRGGTPGPGPGRHRLPGGWWTQATPSPHEDQTPPRPWAGGVLGGPSRRRRAAAMVCGPTLAPASLWSLGWGAAGASPRPRVGGRGDRVRHGRPPGRRRGDPGAWFPRVSLWPERAERLLGHWGSGRRIPPPRAGGWRERPGSKVGLG